MHDGRRDTGEQLSFQDPIITITSFFILVLRTTASVVRTQVWGHRSAPLPTPIVTQMHSAQLIDKVGYNCRTSMLLSSPLITAGALCGECRDGKGVSALLNRCVSCPNAYGLLILGLRTLSYMYILRSTTLCSNYIIVCLYWFSCRGYCCIYCHHRCRLTPPGVDIPVHFLYSGKKAITNNSPCQADCVIHHNITPCVGCSICCSLFSLEFFYRRKIRKYTHN